MSESDTVDHVARVEEALESRQLLDLCEVESGELYDVVVRNAPHCESDHFHNGLLVAMYNAGYYPLHVDFESQEVEFNAK